MTSDSPQDEKPLDEGILRFFVLLGSLEHELGLKQDFLHDLLDEGDWSFVIKLHALMEAAIANLLSVTLHRDELLPTFARLPLHDTQFGKLAFVKSLNLLEDRDRRFLRSLSEYRNRLAHDISYVNFSFAEHTAGLDSPQRRKLQEDFDLPSTKGEAPLSGSAYESPTAIRRFIWFRGMYLLTRVYLRVWQSRSEQAERAQRDRRIAIANALLGMTIGGVAPPEGTEGVRGLLDV